MDLRTLTVSTALLLCAAAAPAAIVINEVDSDTPGTDAAEFVELYNSGGTPVDLGAGNFVLVLYNGNGDISYAAIDLAGSIAAGGYYVVGNTGVPGVNEILPVALQNGQDAVALYNNSDAVANFPNGTAPTTTNLVDAVVYDNGQADDTALIAALTPGEPQVNEDLNGQGTTQSIQRVPDGAGGALNTDNFATADATPNAANSAPAGPVLQTNVTALNFGNFNDANTGDSAARTFSITNGGTGTLTVSTLALAATTDSQFTLGTPSTPLPANLTAGQTVSIVVSFENSDTSTTQTFTGALDYTTSAGNGSIPITATFLTIIDTGNPGDVVLNEIGYNPNAGPTNGGVQDFNGDGVPSTTQDEFVELYNTTGSLLNVQGWEVTAVSGSPNVTTQTTILSAGTVISPESWIVLFNGGTPTGFAPGVAYVGVPPLGNAGEQLSLTDNATEVDEVAFEDEEDRNGGGTDAGVTSEGGSIGLLPDGELPYRYFPPQGVTPGESNGVLTPVRAFDQYR